MIKETIWGHEMWLPDDNPEVLRHSRACVTGVLEGEYSYPRDRVEDVRTIVDIGCNLGVFIVWAKGWWPAVESATAYEPNDAARHIAVENIHGLLTGCSYLSMSAVTTRDNVDLSSDDNWGGRHLTPRASGRGVFTIHPRDLPPCDVLKVDCEGCELEVFEHYPHLGGCKVVAFEYHRPEFREPIMSRLRALGFEMRRGNPLPVETDVQVWVKP